MNNKNSFTFILRINPDVNKRSEITGVGGLTVFPHFQSQMGGHADTEGCYKKKKSEKKSQ